MDKARLPLVGAKPLLAIERLAALIAGAILLHSLGRLVAKAVLYLRSPYSRDYGEGCVLAMVQLLAERGTYFPPLDDYPYVHGNYPPVFILLLWPFHVFLGPSLWAPRLLSLLATTALIVVTYDLARRLSGSKALGAAAAGLALCPWYVQTWAPLGRVDMLAFLLSMLGLWTVVRGSPPWAAFPFFWLAFFTKQNALLAPAAVLLHLLLERPPVRFGRAALLLIVPLALLFGGLALATGGESYRHLVVYTAAAHYEWGRMAESYALFAAGAAPLLIVIGLSLLRLPERFRSGPGRLMLLYWALNLAALATIAKAGAAQNYFIEPWLATILLAMVALPGLATALATEPATRALVVAAAAAVAHYSQAAAHRLPPPIRHPERARDFQELWTAVRAAPGPVLSENLAVLAVNRRQVLVEPFGMLLLTETGHFRPDRIVRDCEAGAFALIVTEHRLEKLPGFTRCLETRYEESEVLATYTLWRPRAELPFQ